jgi:acetyl-CoA C-acetyltransferase
MSSDPVVIVAAKRTPLGAFQGALSAAASPDLAAAAIRACVEESGIDITSISEVLLGCVLPAGVGQAPARQAAQALDRRRHGKRRSRPESHCMRAAQR